MNDLKAMVSNLSNLSNLSILIVEDDNVNLDLCKSILNTIFKKVYTAKDGLDGLEKFKIYKPEIILSDVRMPNMDGLEMTKAIKEIDENIQIILLTAYSDQEFLIKAIEVGVDYYLIKPFEVNFFISVLKKVVHKISTNIKSKIITKKLSTAIEQSSNAIVMIDTNKVIEYINPYFINMFGFKEKELINKNIEVLKDLGGNFYEKILDKTSSQKESISELFCKNRYARECYIKLSIFPIFENKKVISFILIIKDKTKLKATQDRLNKENELLLIKSREAMMGELLSNIAHHWKQPISVITAIINDILIGVKLKDIDENTLIKNLEDINKNLIKFTTTIDGFKTSFKSSSMLETINLTKLIDKTISLFKPILDESNISIKNRYRVYEKITTYPNELIQVIYNILINAKETLNNRNIKDKKIKVFLYQKDNYFTIKICDNGGGIQINGENLNKIFEPYFSTKEHLNSKGIGLYITKTIVEKHLNGKIKVINKRKATCFLICINSQVS